MPSTNGYRNFLISPVHMLLPLDTLLSIHVHSWMNNNRDEQRKNGVSMPVTIEPVIPLLMLSSSRMASMAALSKTSLTLIGVVLLVIIVAGIGGMLYMRKKQATGGRSKISLPMDTSILPKIPREDVASVFSRRNMRQTSKTAAISPVSASTPAQTYNTVPPVPTPAAPPETPRPLPVQSSPRLPDGYNAQGTSLNPNSGQQAPVHSSIPSFAQLPETPRPHPQVGSDSQSRQQQVAHEAVLEAMIRQAQRGIFATPGKDDL